MRFVDVIIPLALPKPLTYGIPLEYQGIVEPGMRVEVQVGRQKIYAGVVVHIHNNKPEEYTIKPIKGVIDDVPILNHSQLYLWKWVSAYYACSLGEVMQAALPAHLKLMNESLLVWNELLVAVPDGLSDNAYLVAEALFIKRKLKISEVRQLLLNTPIQKVINTLLEREIATVSETLEERYKPKLEEYVRLKSAFVVPEAQQKLMTDLVRAPKQLALVMSFLHLSKNNTEIKVRELVEKAKANRSQVKALVEKGVWELYRKTVTRAFQNVNNQDRDVVLTDEQKKVYRSICEQWKQKSTVLLHGVTGSGKTLIYIQLLQDAINRGKQALLLVPEIALTTQIVARLVAYFGDELGIYHSRFSDNERVEIWRKVEDCSYKVIIGVRSSIWLPFQDLDTIIVDEEHEQTYKQQDPAPRFHARDTAIVYAHHIGAKVLLGSATPSIESNFRAEEGKYGVVRLMNRYRDKPLPTVEIVSAKNYIPALSYIVTEPLLHAIAEELKHNRQVILFQNKRGYAPNILCTNCGWIPHCTQCDVSMTYHKHSDKLRCHYCGYSRPRMHTCESCNSNKLTTKSFGTEKVEEEINRVFKTAKVGRLDLDAVKSKNAHSRILEDFEKGAIQILVGTQMVVKGLDFKNVGLVGVLHADSVLSFPNFRVNEKAFQLLEQVSGRAGRHDTPGRVLIQAYDTKHEVLKLVQRHDYFGFYKHELSQRQTFFYPPFNRLMRVVVRHVDEAVSALAAEALAALILKYKNILVQGPSPALVSKVKNQYIQEIWVKYAMNREVGIQLKKYVLEQVQTVKKQRGNSKIHIFVDVDAH